MLCTTPVSRLGLMVLVEDGDDAHREPLAPYPNTRDVAMIRAHHTGCALVLSSSVPSLAASRWLSMGYFRALESMENTRPRVFPTALTLARDESFSPARLPTQAHQAAKEALQTGPVLVQVFRAGFSTGLACKDCGERGGCTRCQGPLGLADGRRVPVCQWCGHTETPWQCRKCSGRTIVPRGQGIGRTISDLGKAFPKVPVIQSDGTNRVLAIGDSPALVVATRGAEPLCPSGYQVALLLDGVAMLSRESLSTLDDTVRSWESAISLVRPDGKVFVTEVEGSPALGVASGSYQALLSQELAEREATRLPPALRIASVSGPAGVVSEIREKIVSLDSSIDALGPVSLGEGNTRSILRFPYSLGQRVTQELRAAHLLQMGRQGRNKTFRVRIVVDDPGQLDALVAE
jgi:primosomal protein N' (replication factor Y) (superfamily II helicase)